MTARGRIRDRKDKGGLLSSGRGRWPRVIALIAYTPDGEGPRLLAGGVTIDAEAVSPEVVEPGGGRSRLRSGPVEPVRVATRVLAVLGAASAEHGLEPRTSAGDERIVCGPPLVGGLLPQPAVSRGQPPPLVVGRQPPAVPERRAGSLRRRPRVQPAVTPAIRLGVVVAGPTARRRPRDSASSRCGRPPSAWTAARPAPAPEPRRSQRSTTREWRCPGGRF